MKEETPSRSDPWPRGFEEHQLQQLRRLAALPLWLRLEWLEEAQRLAGRIRPSAAPSDADDAGT